MLGIITGVTKIFVVILFYPFAALMPRNPKKILFGAWGGEQFSDNPFYFMEYILSCEKGYQCYWIGNESIRGKVEAYGRVRFVKKGSLSAIYHILTAKWMCSNIFLHADITTFPTYGKVKILNLWHGTAFKGAGRALEPHVSWARRLWRLLFRRVQQFASPQTSFATFSSHGMCTKMADVFPDIFPVERSVPYGSPRIDYLIHKSQDPSYSLQIKKKYAAILGIPVEKRWYLYLPTWRKGLAVNFSFLNSPLVSRYQDLLSHMDAVLIEKQHPQVLAELGLKGGLDGNILGISSVLAAQINIQELLLVSDLLITDYSSCFCDFASMHRPVIHWVYDYDRYVREERGVDDYPLKDYAAGVVVRTENELVKALGTSDELLLQAQAPKFPELVAGETGTACERFAKWVGLI